MHCQSLSGIVIGKHNRYIFEHNQPTPKWNSVGRSILTPTEYCYYSLGSVVRYRLWVGKVVHSSVPTNSVRLSLITELHSSTEYLTSLWSRNRLSLMNPHLLYMPFLCALPFLCDMLQSNLVVFCYVDQMLGQLLEGLSLSRDLYW